MTFNRSVGLSATVMLESRGDRPRRTEEILSGRRVFECETSD